MKFATIMREAGVCSRVFNDCSDINITLYGESDTVTQEEDVHYVEPLFKYNEESFNQFLNLVDEINCDPSYLSINVKITETHVIVFYKTPKAKIFRRGDSHLDPLDYAD